MAILNSDPINALLNLILFEFDIKLDYSRHGFSVSFN